MSIKGQLGIAIERRWRKEVENRRINSKKGLLKANKKATTFSGSGLYNLYSQALGIKY